MPPHLAKAEHPGHGTRRPGLASERPRKRGSGTKEQERVNKIRRRRRSPSGKARGGGLDPATVGSHHWQGQAVQVDQRRGAAVEERGVQLGLP
jgi:hypothetical protein